MEIVICDKTTKEVVACIPTSTDKSGFTRSDYEAHVYEGTEPLFHIENNVCYLSEGKCMYKYKREGSE